MVDIEGMQADWLARERRTADLIKRCYRWLSDTDRQEWKPCP